MQQLSLLPATNQVSSDHSSSKNVHLSGSSESFKMSLSKAGRDVENETAKYVGDVTAPQKTTGLSPIVVSKTVHDSSLPNTVAPENTGDLNTLVLGESGAILPVDTQSLPFNFASDDVPPESLGRLLPRHPAVNASEVRPGSEMSGLHGAPIELDASFFVQGQSESGATASDKEAVWEKKAQGANQTVQSMAFNYASLRASPYGPEQTAVKSDSQPSLQDGTLPNSSFIRQNGAAPMTGLESAVLSDQRIDANALNNAINNTPAGRAADGSGRIELTITSVRASYASVPELGLRVAQSVPGGEIIKGNVSPSLNDGKASVSGVSALQGVAEQLSSFTQKQVSDHSTDSPDLKSEHSIKRENITTLMPSGVPLESADDSKQFAAKSAIESNVSLGQRVDSSALAVPEQGAATEIKASPPIMSAAVQGPGTMNDSGSSALDALDLDAHFKSILEGTASSNKQSALGEPIELATTKLDPSAQAQKVTEGAKPSEPVPPRPYVSSLGLPVTDTEWANQLSQKLMWMSARNIQSAELHLNPADMGPIDIKIQVGGDQSSIHFNTPNQSVRELLEANIHRLRDMLNTQADNSSAEQGFSNNSHSQDEGNSKGFSQSSYSEAAAFDVSKGGQPDADSSLDKSARQPVSDSAVDTYV